MSWEYALETNWKEKKSKEWTGVKDRFRSKISQIMKIIEYEELEDLRTAEWKYYPTEKTKKIDWVEQKK